jgi:hypothetical protein
MPKQLRETRIADLNDRFRKNLVTGGRAYMTAGVNAKGPEFVAKAHDPDLSSEDASDPAKTERTLTVMLAEEY